ncbi:MAG: AtpZ/AtpI family protein [Balneola sp.]
MRLPEEYAKYLALGAEIAATLLIPIGLGYLADKFLNSSPYGILIGAISGIFIFFILIFKIANSNGGKDRKK